MVFGLQVYCLTRVDEVNNNSACWTLQCSSFLKRKIINALRSSNNKCPSLDFDRFNERAIATQKFVFFFSFWLGVFVCWFMLCIALKYNNVQSHLINNWINEFSSTAPLWFWCFARDAFLFRFQHRINCLFVYGSERVSEWSVWPVSATFPPL